MPHEIDGTNHCRKTGWKRPAFLFSLTSAERGLQFRPLLRPTLQAGFGLASRLASPGKEAA